MAETGKDFDQLLRVLIHAPARRIGRIQIVLIVIRRRNRRLATRRPERQMHHVRRDTANAPQTSNEARAPSPRTG